MQLSLSTSLQKSLTAILTAKRVTFQLWAVRAFVSTTCIMCKPDYLPSSLQGPPVKALVAPGECQFSDKAISVPVLAKYRVSDTTSLIRFGVPDTSKPLGLSTCACLLAIAEINGETVIRPYTPVSTNACIGYFDLLIKNYGTNGKMSRFLCDSVQPGESSVAFKHISFNVKKQAPFPYKQIGMIVGGTGKLTVKIMKQHFSSKC
jgi:cytochrome-b5 reductase